MRVPAPATRGGELAIKILWNPEQLRLTFESMNTSIDRCERDWPHVFDREPRQSHDGYPPQSMGGARRAGKGRHADPTQQVVLQIVGGDAVGSDVAKFFGLVYQAATLLEQADSLRARILPPEKKPEVDLSMWCESCLRVEHVDHLNRSELVHTPARDNARDCWFCYRHARANGGEWPSLALVAKHHAGQRIYERDVVAAKAGRLTLKDVPGYRPAVSKNGRAR